MTGPGANEGEVDYDDLAWDSYCEEETIDEARTRMSDAELAADLAFDPFAEDTK